MHSHLVTIEIGVERGTYQWMKLDCLTLYQCRLKCLNTKTVKCRGTVQHNRVLTDNLLQHIPYLRLKLLNHLLGLLNIVCCSVCYQFLHNERLEQLNSHLLRKTTLIDLKFRTNDDNGTAGIVNTLT